MVKPRTLSIRARVPPGPLAWWALDNPFSAKAFALMSPTVVWRYPDRQKSRGTICSRL